MSESALSVAARASWIVARDTTHRYPGECKGQIAIDGSRLDRADHGERNEYFAWASAWLLSCGCVKPEFRRLVAGVLIQRGCDEHRRRPLEAPAEDPWPMSAAERRAAEERVWPRVATRYSIPNRYRLVRLEEGDPTPSLLAVREFLEDEANDERCLVLAGPTGVGKTHALVAAFREQAVWSCAADLAAFYTMPALARALLDDEDRDDVFEACVEADVLVIDDIGGTYVKEGGLVEASLEEILVSREGDQLATLLSTNLTLPAFTAAVGDRVADRIRGSWGTWCSLPGQSLRRKRAGGRP